MWNDLLQLFVHHTIAPLLVPALDDSSELSLALSRHLNVFTVMQHGLPVELVDVEAVLSAAASDLENDSVMMQAAAALEAEVAGSVPLEDEVITLSEEYFPQFFVGDTVNLAALSKAVNVSHEFLGVNRVAETQAAAVATQAVAAREAESLFFNFCERRWCNSSLSWPSRESLFGPRAVSGSLCAP